MLDKAFGPGRAIVTIDVTLNHDQVKVTREDVIPGNSRAGEASGTLTRKRTTTGAGNPALDEAGRIAGATGTTSAETEYQNGRRVEQVVSMPGSIRHLSVGIMLPPGIAPERIDELRQVISMTVGLSPERGDEIAIAALGPLGGAPMSAEAPGPGAAASSAAESEAPAVQTAEKAWAEAPRSRWLWALFAALVLLLVALGYALARRAGPKRLSPAARPRSRVHERHCTAARRWRSLPRGVVAQRPEGGAMSANRPRLWATLRRAMPMPSNSRKVVQ